MRRRMTDAEVWLEIAEHMKNSQTLPTRVDRPLSGLCAILQEMDYADIIHANQRWRLRKQLYAKYSSTAEKYYGYFWKPSAVKPRIRACEALAKDCMTK